jgi:hypothetical protein
MTRRTRLQIEALDDRCLPSFTWGGDYSIDDFYQQLPPGGAFVEAHGPGVTADFNSDGQGDLFSFDWPGMGDVAAGSVFLGRRDGTFDQVPAASAGGDVMMIATGDFNSDGRPDLAMMYWNSSVAGGYDVQVLLNDGDWGWGRTTT